MCPIRIHDDARTAISSRKSSKPRKVESKPWSSKSVNCAATSSAGTKPDHPGWFRTKPKYIDHTEEVSLDACPNYGSKDLPLCAEVEEHTGRYRPLRPRSHALSQARLLVQELRQQSARKRRSDPSQNPAPQ